MDAAVEDFIAQNAHKSTAELALLMSKKADWPKEYILNQINGRQKAIKKYPFLLGHETFRFPPSRAVEQSSSELTAKYKAALFKGKSMHDLSGGMGLDSYFFSLQFDTVDYVERNQELFELATYNFHQVLNASSISTYNTDAVSFLKQEERKVHLIYIDPDRRATKSKAFLIEDCEPNIAAILPQIWERSHSCLIKLSPMLDISEAISQLKGCKEFHVLAVKNDCKELLFLLEKDFEGEPKIVAKELAIGQESSFSFLMSEERELNIALSEPQNFLYEPNVAVLKSGGFKSIAQQYQLKKLAINTHLYTSNQLIPDFPGRSLKIKTVTAPKKGISKKANVVCKNFPQTAAELRKKYKIQDGGKDFLYACSINKDKKVFILAEKV